MARIWTFQVSNIVNGLTKRNLARSNQPEIYFSVRRGPRG